MHLGWSEILLIVVVILVLFGSQKIPEIARSIKIDPAEKMVLVENGKSNCVIVLSENASPTAGFAAGFAACRGNNDRCRRDQ